MSLSEFSAFIKSPGGLLSSGLCFAIALITIQIYSRDEYKCLASFTIDNHTRIEILDRTSCDVGRQLCFRVAFNDSLLVGPFGWTIASCGYSFRPSQFRLVQAGDLFGVTYRSADSTTLIMALDLAQHKVFPNGSPKSQIPTAIESQLLEQK